MKRTLGLVAIALAFAPASANADDGTVYVRSRAFRIPIKVADGPDSVETVHVYVSEDRGKTWDILGEYAADVGSIPFRAKKDGIYWFDVRRPDIDANAESDAVLGIVIDTVAPKLKVSPMLSQRGDRGVRWEFDGSAVPETFRLAVFTGGANWQSYSVARAEGQQIWFDDIENLTKIQLMVADKAGNRAIRQLNLRGTKYAVETPSRFALDSEKPGSVAAAPKEPIAPAMPAPKTDHEVRRVLHSRPERVDVLRTPPVPKATVIGKPTIDIDYANANPEEVTVVELWGTRDDGKSWIKLAEDEDRLSPIVAEIPEEGRWGLMALHVLDSAPSGVAPASGSIPQTYVELDTVEPDVRMLNLESDEEDVLIRWIAKDPNLVDKPMRLSYARSPRGPWKIIAVGIENDGEYRWDGSEAPAGERVWVRVEAMDRARNVGTAISTSGVEANRSGARAFAPKRPSRFLR